MSRRLEFCTGGFRYCSHRPAEDVLWSGVVRAKETILYERPPVLKGAAKFLVPKVASSNYTVVAASGKEYLFTGDSVGRIKQFGKLLRAHAEKLGLPWETEEKHL